ncbi:MAG: four helix bundle protein [Fluviicola sp.]|jgi:four helix bundle protein|uniref:four helix bundle protein n=1 Tax=Fluviicola sp. TaxID=1917219 RepID=UPI002615A990|nr:four helix bundle protein [Fluviicola sp.]MDF3028821.1 four helix bundle protein [Fluviicola sp.]
MVKTHNFRELQIWKESIAFVKSIYELTSSMDSSEKFGLTSQMNRCAVSIPSNIAEGSGRSSEKEFIRFLDIAISSSYELETQLILVCEIYDISTEPIIDQLTILQKKIGAFKRTLNTN